jgi:zinc protease
VKSELRPSTFRLTPTGLAPVRVTLDNGAVVVLKHTATTPAVAIHLAIRAGSICDPPGAAGTTWLLSRVIDRGTARLSAADIAEELDSRGVTLTLNVTRHVMSIVCTALADDFEPVLSLLGDIVIAPSLPDDEIATRKGEVITAIRQDEDNPLVRASETLIERLYPNGHPYGRRTKGSVDVVERITREQLLQLHAERFAPGELSVAVVGDIELSQAQAVVARVFGGWSVPAPRPVPVPPVVPATDRTRIVIPMMNKAQADIAYGFTTIRRNDPRYYAFWLMNNVFGQYAIGGRLGDSIRERQGMAYYVSSSFDANIAEGPLVVRAGVSPGNVDRAVSSIDDEVRRLIGEGISAKELDDSKRFLIGSIPRALETNAAIAAFLQNVEFFDLGFDYDVRLPDLLSAVTLDDANRAARQALDPDRATLVIAGPYAES